MIKTKNNCWTGGVVGVVLKLSSVICHCLVLVVQ